MARRRNPTLPFLATASLTLVALSLVLITVLRSEESDGPDAGVTLSDIADEPSEYYGSRVAVSGKIAEIVTPRLFTLGDGGLLVLSSEPLPRPAGGRSDASLSEGDTVQVRGLVREFKLEELGERIDAGQEVDLFTPYHDRPVIIADSISASFHGERTSRPVEVSVDDVADDPSEFYGEQVIVTSEVNRLLGPRAFTIGGEIAGIPPPEMVVITAGNSLPDLREDAAVVITGTVRSLSLEEIEEETGADLHEGLFPLSEVQPVIIADSVRTTQTR